MAPTAEGTTSLEILRFTLDERRCLVLLPHLRRRRIVGAAHSLLRAACSDRRWVRTKTLQRFCGLAASASLAIPLARFRLRALYAGTVVLRHRSRLTNRALGDLLWWTGLGSAVDVGRALVQQPSRVEFSTDASGYSWGAVRDNLKPARGFFSLKTTGYHIKRKELLAIILALESCPDLRGPGVVRVLTRGPS